MGNICELIWYAFAGLFRSRASLEAEILMLRHQLNVLRRKSPARIAFSPIDKRCPGPKQPSETAPDQLAKIAHQPEHQPIRAGMARRIGFSGRDNPERGAVGLAAFR